MLEQILLERQVDKQTHLEHKYINRWTDILNFQMRIIITIDMFFFQIYETSFPPFYTRLYDKS